MLEGRIQSLLEERETRFRDRYSALGMNTGPLVHHEHYLLRLDTQVRELRAELERAEKKRREMQEGYLEASKKRKVLGKLRERRAQDYYKQQLMDEMKEVDDINNAAAVRRGVRREGETP
jgi:flagellar FliJ protein